MTHPLPHLLRALLLPLLLLAGTAHAELASHTSFKGEVTAYTYDVMGRETTRVYGDGQQVRTTYTPTGQVASVSDARGTMTYAYDDGNRLVQVTDPSGAVTTYAWDEAGNLIEQTLPNGVSMYRAYDDNGQLGQNCRQ